MNTEDALFFVRLCHYFSCLALWGYTGCGNVGRSLHLSDEFPSWSPKESLGHSECL